MPISEQKPGPAEEDPDKSSSASRPKLVLLLLVALCLGSIAILAAMNRYLYFLKSMLIPVLFIAAFFSGRFKQFLKDWGMFLGGVILFDFLRGFTYIVICKFNLPVYVNYAISLDRLVCGSSSILTVTLQGLSHLSSAEKTLDSMAIFFHSTHFFFFLVSGLAIWFFRREEFPQYRLGVLIIMYSSLLGYLFVPTAPPWMAAAQFHVLPPVRHIAWQFYNIRMPAFEAIFNVNPIAAMPSLHVALPTFCAMLGLRLFGRKAFWMPFYAIGIFLSVVYLGEHYVIDGIAAVLLTLIVYLVVYYFPFSFFHRTTSSLFLRRPLVLPLFMIAIAQCVGYLTIHWRQNWNISRSFIQRELKQSDLSDYYSAVEAYSRNDLAAAERFYASAMNSQSDNEFRSKAGNSFVNIALSRGDYKSIISTLSPLYPKNIQPEGAFVLAFAYAHTGKAPEAISILQDLLKRYGEEPRCLYWLTRLRYEQGELPAAEVEATARRMINSKDPRTKNVGAQLMALLNTPIINPAGK